MRISDWSSDVCSSDLCRWGSETSAGEADIIADFESGAGGDVLDVSGLLPGVAPGAGGNELDAYLNVAFDGTNTTIGIDANGDGSGFTDVTVTVQGADINAGGAPTQQATNDTLLTDGKQAAV